MVIRTERGWQSHLCVQGEFHRNTLLQLGPVEIVVSTVGRYRNPSGIFDTIGSNRHFETMAFHVDEYKWKDADVSREVGFESPWAIEGLDKEIEANDMHEQVVKEITERMQMGQYR